MEAATKSIEAIYAAIGSNTELVLILMVAAFAILATVEVVYKIRQKDK